MNYKNKMPKYKRSYDKSEGVLGLMKSRSGIETSELGELEPSEISSQKYYKKYKKKKKY